MDEPKFIATTEEEEIYQYGEGNTSLEAFDDWIAEWAEEEAINDINAGNESNMIKEVSIYSVIYPKLGKHIKIKDADIEFIADSWYDNFCEYFMEDADLQMNNIPELTDMLNNILHRWAVKNNNHPHWWMTHKLVNKRRVKLHYLSDNEVIYKEIP